MGMSTRISFPSTPNSKHSNWSVEKKRAHEKCVRVELTCLKKFYATQNNAILNP